MTSVVPVCEEAFKDAVHVLQQRQSFMDRNLGWLDETQKWGRLVEEQGILDDMVHSACELAQGRMDAMLDVLMRGELDPEDLSWEF